MHGAGLSSFELENEGDLRLALVILLIGVLKSSSAHVCK